MSGIRYRAEGTALQTEGFAIFSSMKIWSVSHIFAKLDKIADISRSRYKNCKLTPMQGGYRYEYCDRKGMCPQVAGLHVGYTAPEPGAAPILLIFILDSHCIQSIITSKSDFNSAFNSGE